MGRKKSKAEVRSQWSFLYLLLIFSSERKFHKANGYRWFSVNFQYKLLHNFLGILHPTSIKIWAGFHFRTFESCINSKNLATTHSHRVVHRPGKTRWGAIEIDARKLYRKPAAWVCRPLKLPKTPTIIEIEGLPMQSISVQEFMTDFYFALPMFNNFNLVYKVIMLTSVKFYILNESPFWSGPSGQLKNK